MTISYDKLFIGGEWVQPATSARIEVTSASTGEPIGSVPEAQEADIDTAVVAARRAFDEPGGWSQWEPMQRAAAMESLAVQLESRAEEMAQRVSMQNGMPISIARQLEGGFPLVVLRYFAKLLETASFEDERPHLLGGTTIVRREPIGVVGAIAPWNYPQTLAAFKHAPAMAAGCTMVLKPSPETVLDAFLFAEALEASDIPAGVINIVPGGREVGAYLVQHRDVDKVAFTGSTAAGRQIAETCGRLLRPVTLELGGKSAAIVLDDADLDLAKIGNDLFAATLVNNGPRPGDPDRADGIQHAPRPGRALHRQGLGRRRPAGRRWRAPQAARRRLVRRAHGVRRRRQQLHHRAGGDFRAGPRGHPLHRCRRRDPAGQRLRLRARRLGLDLRCRARPGRCPPGPHRHDRR
jgi:acyl-CoA reductase-like NAD-dependent aldehyde dehydrogenase